MTAVADRRSRVVAPPSPRAPTGPGDVAAPPRALSDPALVPAPQPALADPSGRRARVLKRAGFALAIVLTLWLVGLALAGLGLFPSGDVPFGRALAGSGSSVAQHGHARRASASARSSGSVADPPRRVASLNHPAAAVGPHHSALAPQRVASRASSGGGAGATRAAGSGAYASGPATGSGATSHSATGASAASSPASTQQRGRSASGHLRSGTAGRSSSAPGHIKRATNAKSVAPGRAHAAVRRATHHKR
jgi:hypothetical protein